MSSPMTMTRGTQIVYLPPHAKRPIVVREGVTFWPSEAQFGFVTSTKGPYAYCRFWTDSTATELRTKANSEAVPLDMITKHQLVTDEEINFLLVAIMG